MIDLRCGDALATLKTLDSGIARTCVTSPPYWGLRDYGVDGQIGLESSPDAYVARLVEVFREVRRVLTDDGTLWLNLGDSYAGSNQTGGSGAETITGGKRNQQETMHAFRRGLGGLKPKDLIGIPWRVAFALQADGWYLRSDIIWHKPNPMPESVRDRPTKAHEYVFLMAKAQRYYYDADAIREPTLDYGDIDSYRKRVGKARYHDGNSDPAGGGFRGEGGFGKTMPTSGRNRRSVWTVAPRPFKMAHFATFPPALIEPCILAGSAPGDIVLDPFAGACTTGLVATQHGRRFVGIELNPDYVAMGRARISAARSATPLLARTS